MCSWKLFFVIASLGYCCLLSNWKISPSFFFRYLLNPSASSEFVFSFLRKVKISRQVKFFVQIYSIELTVYIGLCGSCLLWQGCFVTLFDRGKRNPWISCDFAHSFWSYFHVARHKDYREIILRSCFYITHFRRGKFLWQVGACAILWNLGEGDRRRDATLQSLHIGCPCGFHFLVIIS